jgi:hypothetical protein
MRVQQPVIRQQGLKRPHGQPDLSPDKGRPNKVSGTTAYVNVLRLFATVCVGTSHNLKAV